MSSVTTNGNEKKGAQKRSEVNESAYYLCTYTERPVIVDVSRSYSTWSMAYQYALRRGAIWDAVGGKEVLAHPEMFTIQELSDVR